MHLTEETGETQLIFIYGTLKQGFPNSQHMPASTKYAGTACTTVPVPLVVDTEMGIPYLVLAPNHPEAKIVQGELYYADKAAIEALDNFEGLQTGFYVREDLNVIHPSPCTSDDNPPGEVITVTAYFRSPANGGPAWAKKWTVEKLLTLPMVDNYSAEHAGGFTARTDRNGY